MARLAVATAALLIFLSVAPCSGEPLASEEITLRQRVVDYWSAVVARDDCRRRDLMAPRTSPKLGRDEMLVWENGCPPISSRVVQYLSYAVGDIRIEGRSATVQVDVTARITLPRAQAKPIVKTTRVLDEWVKVDGVWLRRSY